MYKKLLNIIVKWIFACYTKAFLKESKEECKSESWSSALLKNLVNMNAKIIYSILYTI